MCPRCGVRGCIGDCLPNPKTIFDTPLQNYMRQHIRNHDGLPFWSLDLGIQGVLENEGWISPGKKQPTNTDILKKIFQECPMTHEQQEIVSICGKESGFDYVEIITKGATTSWRHIIHTEEI